MFSVVEVGGRPALGARAGARGEWTVGGLVLPVPGDIRRLSSLLSRVQSNITHRCRLSPGTHQCSVDIYDTFSGFASILPWRKATV